VVVWYGSIFDTYYITTLPHYHPTNPVPFAPAAPPKCHAHNESLTRPPDHLLPMHPRPRKSYRRLFRVLFIGMGLLLGFILASVMTEMAADEVRAELDNAVMLERDLGQLLSTLQDAETGQRGYLLTHRASYLLPYQNALDSVSPILQRIGEEVMTDSTQLQRVDTVRHLIAEKFQELSRTLTLSSKGDTTRLTEIVLSDYGQEVMMQIREKIQQLRDAENADIAKRQRQLRRLSTTTTVLRLLGAAGLVFVFYYLYAQLRPLYASLSETNAALKLKNRELDHFAHTASHDLREPLRTVSNYVEVLAEEQGHRLSDEGREYLSVIHRASDRMRALIESLLLYSRVGRGEQIELVDLKQTMREVQENLALSISESGAKVRVTDLPTIKGYAIALRQLLQNLVANALKFRQPGQPPRIEVTAVTKARVTQLRVRDYGIGMTESEQKKIFQLFTRLHSSKTFEGQGIGLAFCQKIVNLHQGSITVESKPGLGSTFIVTIPRTFSHETPAKNPPH